MFHHDILNIQAYNIHIYMTWFHGEMKILVASVHFSTE